MTTAEAKALLTDARTLRLAILTAATLALLGMAWSSKADADEVQALATKMAGIDSMVTDLWCEKPAHQYARRCR